jgi:hypothetical protein
MMAKTNRSKAISWSAQEDALLYDLKMRNVRWLDIMPSLPGRTKLAAQLRWYKLQRPDMTTKAEPYKNPYSNTRMDFRLERDVAAARQRAALLPAEHPDLTGRILGDPIPGRSALDRREAAARVVSLAGFRDAETRLS